MRLVVGGESERVCERVTVWQAPRHWAGRSHCRAPGLSRGDIVHAGKKRANVFSLPVENDSERRPCLLAGAGLTLLCHKMIFHRC